MWRFVDKVFYAVAGLLFVAVTATYGLPIWLSIPGYLLILAVATRTIPGRGQP